MKYDYNGDVKKLYQQKTDKKTDKEYFDFCISILNQISNIVKNSAAVFWNVAYNANARSDYGKIVFSDYNPFSVQETIVWDKTHAFPTASKGILSRRCELVFLMSKEKYFTNQGENEVIDNLWVVNSNGSQHELHKACYPIGLPTKGINLCSKQGDIIYEPFTGTGTTMVAAHQLQRKCYGMEIDPVYCQVIIDRMLKLDSNLEVIVNGKQYK
jgi:DNA modification methylase